MPLYHWLGKEAEAVPLLLTDCIADPMGNLARLAQLQAAASAPYAYGAQYFPWQPIGNLPSLAQSGLTQMIGNPLWP